MSQSSSSFDFSVKLLSNCVICNTYCQCLSGCCSYWSLVLPLIYIYFSYLLIIYTSAHQLPITHCLPPPLHYLHHPLHSIHTHHLLPSYMLQTFALIITIINCSLFAITIIYCLIINSIFLLLFTIIFIQASRCLIWQSHRWLLLHQPLNWKRWRTWRLN